ncbi:hypothetical protein [Avibacterium paragallinarum]|uniref:Uncharacterized protein n=3 Tax=Avibacterium paragallinarum TaxID=728 RepID=A0AAE5THB1_AVIPA|nr:hypothetical protein [Avibacterium paragallinarum]PXZ38732.1 hypothetical protein DM482_07860 [Avibacterium paragallinarum]PXZ42561.1 hypothetical protein DM481_00750 [Avibacterium paragallinarum]QZP16285.1 hypothetical protein K5O18_02770 [Avibacterium paragallinarum]WAL57397.1 hypothetical protein OY678_03285 [Avibacterium paragallinarum]WAM60353.1 hypothetical protein OW731_05400 [Avibacterium paragallinarum]
MTDTMATTISTFKGFVNQFDIIESADRNIIDTQGSEVDKLIFDYFIENNPLRNKKYSLNQVINFAKRNHKTLKLLDGKYIRSYENGKYFLCSDASLKINGQKVLAVAYSGTIKPFTLPIIEYAVYHAKSIDTFFNILLNFKEIIFTNKVLNFHLMLVVKEGVYLLYDLNRLSIYFHSKKDKGIIGIGSGFQLFIENNKEKFSKNNALLEDVHCYAMKNDPYTNNLVAMVDFNGDKIIQKNLILIEDSLIEKEEFIKENNNKTFKKEISNEKIKALVKCKLNFSIQTDDISREALRVERIIEENNFSCRVYTENRLASVGLSLLLPNIVGIATLAGIAAHNLLTLNPDYEIGKNILDSQINITYQA